MPHSLNTSSSAYSQPFVDGIMPSAGSFFGTLPLITSHHFASPPTVRIYIKIFACNTFLQEVNPLRPVFRCHRSIKTVWCLMPFISRKPEPRTLFLPNLGGARISTLAVLHYYLPRSPQGSFSLIKGVRSCFRWGVCVLVFDRLSLERRGRCFRLNFLRSRSVCA